MEEIVLPIVWCESDNDEATLVDATGHQLGQVWRVKTRGGHGWWGGADERGRGVMPAPGLVGTAMLPDRATAIEMVSTRIRLHCQSDQRREVARALMEAAQEFEAGVDAPADEREVDADTSAVAMGPAPHPRLVWDYGTGGVATLWCCGDAEPLGAVSMLDRQGKRWLGLVPDNSASGGQAVVRRTEGAASRWVENTLALARPELRDAIADAHGDRVGCRGANWQAH